MIVFIRTFAVVLIKAKRGRKASFQNDCDKTSQALYATLAVCQEMPGLVFAHFKFYCFSFLQPIRIS
jgi:hypothetical protein